jgi:hypothetical protein
MWLETSFVAMGKSKSIENYSLNPVRPIVSQ